MPPRISPFNFEKDITEGLRTQLMCSSSLGDQPFNITWLKDQRIISTRNSNKPIDGGNIPSGSDNDFGMWKSSTANDQSQYYIDNTIHINEYAPFSSILSIENLTSHHNGNYTCRISNLGGTVDHTAVLSVAGLYNKIVFFVSSQAIRIGLFFCLHSAQNKTKLFIFGFALTDDVVVINIKNAIPKYHYYRYRRHGALHYTLIYQILLHKHTLVL